MTDALTETLDRPGADAGPLAGRTFVVKENIAVAGRVSTNGHPLWAQTHAPEGLDAPVVARLLASGARLVGKAHMDEMAYSLLGANPHYGTPRNPAAPDRHPGGSSSGSAAAIAGGVADFALGTDTAGSCRAPAGFCGVFGFRSSHGAISTVGIIPLAPSLDVVGWFARDMATMIAVGDALLPADIGDGFGAGTLLDEAFAQAEAPFGDAAAPVIGALRDHCGLRESALGDDFFAEALTHFRNLQAFEAWASIGPWITKSRPRFGAGVSERLAIAAQVTPQQKRAAEIFREEARARIDALLGAHGFLVVPTAPFPSPKLDEDEATLDAKRYRMMKIFLIASYFGLPQISIPLMRDGPPLGLSLIGRRWSDRSLLALAAQITLESE